MVSRNFAWIDDSIEHSEQDYARASALAKKWSSFDDARRDLIARMEEGYDREMGCDDCEHCANGDYHNCPEEVANRARAAALQAERDLEIELIEDKLIALGARMMRPHEHWIDDSIEYMESERY